MKKITIKIGLIILFIIGISFIPGKTVQAVNCTSQGSGSTSLTISSDCTFGDPIDGVDSGAGASNTSSITIQNGATLTVGAGQQIAWGSIVKNPGGKIVKVAGSSLIKGRIYMLDGDADGYPALGNATLIATISATTISRGVARATALSAGKISFNSGTGRWVTTGNGDCNDNDNAKYQNLTGYTDGDGDGEGDGSWNTGDKFPGTAADSGSGGTLTWTSPTNVSATDGVPSTSQQFGAPASTNFLNATNFGMSIPSGATITGVVVKIVKQDNFGGTTLTDQTVKLIKGGTAQGNNKASGTDWPALYTTSTYGSSNDLWGLTLAPSDITASTFGVAVQAQAGNSSRRNANIDSITIRVYYTTGSSSQVCSGASLPSGYASNNNDCRDNNATVKSSQSTNQTSTYTDLNSAASWDYNCNGDTDLQYPSKLTNGGRACVTTDSTYCGTSGGGPSAPSDTFFTAASCGGSPITGTMGCK